MQLRTVDAHRIDGSRLRAHAEAADVALQRRACRACARQQPVAVADHQLAVGADVEEQADFILLVQVQHQQAADDVAADVVRCGGDDVDEARKVHAQLRAPEPAGIGGHRRKGRGKHRPGVELEQEVDHRGVAGDDQRGAASGGDARLLREAIEQAVEALHRRALHVLHVTVALKRVGDAGQDVRAVDFLAVGLAGLSQYCAAVHVHQLHDDGGGAIVGGEAVVLRAGVARLDIGDLPAGFTADQRRRDAVFARKAGRVQPLQRVQGQVGVGVTLCRQGLQQALLVAAVVLLGGRRHFQIDLFTEAFHTSSIVSGFCAQLYNKWGRASRIAAKNASGALDVGRGLCYDRYIDSARRMNDEVQADRHGSGRHAEQR